MKCRRLACLTVLALAGLPIESPADEKPSRQSGEIVLTKSGAGADLGGPVSLDLKQAPRRPLLLPEGWYVSILPEVGIAGGDGWGGLAGATTRFEKIGAKGPFVPEIFLTYQHLWLEQHRSYVGAPCFEPCEPARREAGATDALTFGGGWILDSGLRSLGGLYVGADAGFGAGRKDDGSFFAGPRFQFTGGIRTGPVIFEAHLGGLAGEVGWASVGLGYRPRL